MNFKVLAILFLFFSNGTYAQWNEGEERRPVPDTEWQKSSGDFGAILLITNKADEFYENWSKPASPEYKPHMSTVSQAKRGDVVTAITLFSGCSANLEGNCNSEIDFKVIKPDGSAYSNHMGTELWINKPAIPVGRLEVSMSNLGFKIELDDQLGEYTIQATVKDLIANTQMVLTQKITIKDFD